MSTVFANLFDPRTYDEHAAPPGMAVDPEGNMTCQPTDRIGIVWLLVNIGAEGGEYQAHQIAGELDCHGPYGSAAMSKIVHRLERLVSLGLLTARDDYCPYRKRFYMVTELGRQRQAQYDLLQ